MTIGLLAFTLANVNRVQSGMFGCGTVDMRSDVVYSNQSKSEHPGLKIFLSNCKHCHRLDKELIGPPLRNSFKTRDSTWFVKMTVSANELISSGDTLATRIFNDYNQTQHPDFKVLSEQQLTDLIAYLRLEEDERKIVY